MTISEIAAINRRLIGGGGKTRGDSSADLKFVHDRSFTRHKNPGSWITIDLHLAQDPALGSYTYANPAGGTDPVMAVLDGVQGRGEIDVGPGQATNVISISWDGYSGLDVYDTNFLTSPLSVGQGIALTNGNQTHEYVVESIT